VYRRAGRGASAAAQAELEARDLHGIVRCMAEPHGIALALTAIGALLVVSVIFSRASERFGVPIVLIFLVIGMLAGSEGIGGIYFDDAELAFRLGTAALVLILFDGGLNTSLAAVRLAAKPAAVLATVGVVATAGLMAVAANLLGAPWPLALLLGAVVSSTDAAAVFAVLRGSGLSLQRRVGTTLEVESGANDPMAVVLTFVLTAQLATPGVLDPWWTAADVLVQFAVGLAFGVAGGFAGRALLARGRLRAGGLYAVFTIGFAFTIFGVTTLANGSGFLAVYASAIVLGNGALPLRNGLLRVHDAIAWLSQIVMFLMLGLLVFPSRLAEVAGTGLALALFLAFVVRPLVVAICLLPFRFSPKEVAYIGWVGLRGAVPIVLATYPVLVGVAGADWIFNVVFFIVVTNAILPGGTVARVTRWLRLERADPPPPRAVLEIESAFPLQGSLRSFYIEPALVVCGSRIGDLPFPDGTAATLIVRGGELIAPRGDTLLLAGDHLYVFAREEDLAFIQLMFGRPEAE
jgi:cell volume regulation protein A